MFILHDLRDASREALGGGFRCREAADLFAAALGISLVDAHITGTDPLRADARERTRYLEAAKALRSLEARERDLAAREEEAAATLAEALRTRASARDLVSEAEDESEGLRERSDALDTREDDLDKREKAIEARERAIATSLVTLETAGLLPREAA